jgi:hypothetical protein
MSQRSRKADNTVEEDESNVPHPVFDVVAKDPKVPHVSTHMQQSAVSEH